MSDSYIHYKYVTEVYYRDHYVTSFVGQRSVATCVRATFNLLEAECTETRIMQVGSVNIERITLTDAEDLLLLEGLFRPLISQ